MLNDEVIFGVRIQNSLFDIIFSPLPCLFNDIKLVISRLV